MSKISFLTRSAHKTQRQMLRRQIVHGNDFFAHISRVKYEIDLSKIAVFRKMDLKIFQP